MVTPPALRVVIEPFCTNVPPIKEIPELPVVEMGPLSVVVPLAASWLIESAATEG